MEQFINTLSKSVYKIILGLAELISNCNLNDKHLSSAANMGEYNKMKMTFDFQLTLLISPT